jgi:hypothetical protein
MNIYKLQLSPGHPGPYLILFSDCIMRQWSWILTGDLELGVDQQGGCLE